MPHICLVCAHFCLVASLRLRLLHRVEPQLISQRVAPSRPNAKTAAARRAAERRSAELFEELTLNYTRGVGGCKAGFFPLSRLYFAAKRGLKFNFLQAEKCTPNEVKSSSSRHLGGLLPFPITI